MTNNLSDIKSELKSLTRNSQEEFENNET